MHKYKGDVSVLSVSHFWNNARRALTRRLSHMGKGRRALNAYPFYLLHTMLHDPIRYHASSSGQDHEAWCGGSEQDHEARCGEQAT
jgi:hypothetical protein